MGRGIVRPGAQACGERVARMLAEVVFEIDFKIGSTRLAELRGLAMRLKAMRVCLRELDQGGGKDAIYAIAQTLSPREWLRLAEDNTLILGHRWSWIVSRAGTMLRKLKRKRGTTSSRPPSHEVATRETMTLTNGCLPAEGIGLEPGRERLLG